MAGDQPVNSDAQVEAEIRHDMQARAEDVALKMVGGPIGVIRQVQSVVSATQGYKFSPQQIEEQIKTCDDLINDIGNDVPEIIKMVNAGPPAPDTVASVPQAKAVSEAGKNLLERNRRQIAFLQDWKQKLEASKQAVMEQEHVTEAEWKRLVGSL